MTCSHSNDLKIGLSLKMSKDNSLGLDFFSPLVKIQLPETTLTKSSTITLVEQGRKKLSMDIIASFSKQATSRTFPGTGIVDTS